MSITPTSTGNYQVFPYFTGTDNACTNAIYLLPPSFTYGSSITFNVPLLYIGGTDYQQYTYSNDDFQFSLVQQGQGAPSQGNISTQVVMKGGNMWKCAQAARQAAYEVARMVARGEGQLEASMVKAYVCKAAEWVTREAMQIHGGMGYAEEYDVSRYFVDARVLSIFEGADETLCLKVVARRLLYTVKPA